jgi:lysophospholipase L1-like esterase
MKTKTMKKILILFGLLIAAISYGQNSVIHIGGVDAYSKTQLQTSGLSSINAINLTNTDEFITYKYEIPDTIYTTVGTEFNIWWDSYYLGLEKYYFDVISSVGNVLDRCWRFTPAATGVENIVITATNKYGVIAIIDSVTIVINNTINPSLNGKNILSIGNSLTAGGIWVNEVDTLINASGITSNFIGTKGIINKHEGIGGKTIAQFITAGSPFYINSKLDFQAYIADSTTANGIDIVIIQLGINDVDKDDLLTAAQITTLKNNCVSLVNAIHSSADGYPNAKIYFSVPPVGANYLKGSTHYNHNYFKNITSLWNAIYNQYQYSLNIDFIPSFLNVDREYGYPKTYQQISARNTDTVLLSNQTVHPDTSGYYQIADMIFSGLTKYTSNDAELIFNTDQTPIDQIALQLRVTSGKIVNIVWGNDDTTEVVGNGITTTTYNSNYLVEGEYVIKIIGDVNEILRLYTTNNTNLSFDIAQCSKMPKINLFGSDLSHAYGDISVFASCPLLKDLLLGRSGEYVYGDIAILKNITGLIDLTMNGVTNGPYTYGDLGELMNLNFTTQLSLYPKNNDTPYTVSLQDTSRWNCNVSLSYNNLSATSVDNLLISLSRGIITSKIISIITGNATRTSASDAAVAILQGRGCTIN